MVKLLLSICIGIVFLVPSQVFAGTASPAGANVYIISPSNGEVVQNPVNVKFGLQGMGVAPAGVDKASDATHKHFGKGQTETNLTLSAGKHTLRLILGDKGHVPFAPPVVSKKVVITVK